MKPIDMTNRLGFRAILLGITCIAAAVTARLTTTSITMSWFDVELSTVSTRAFGILPSMGLALDALMLLGAAIIFAGVIIQRRAVSWWVVLLAIVPVPILIRHGLDSPAAMEQGSMWVAAVLAAVALAHGVRDPRARVVAAALLLGALGPVVVKAAAQVLWEIPATLAWFDANRLEALAMRGLEPGSSAAEVLERRLRNAVPTAWFASANLLGSVLAAGCVAFTAVTIEAVRRRLSSGVAGLTGILAVVMAAFVIQSGSLGGLLAMLVGLVVVGIAMFTNFWRRRGGWLALGIVLLAMLAAPAMGWLVGITGALPLSRSLVIRSGYIEGAAAIVAAEPLLGVGPGGFQEAWLSVRPMESPEEITSPHAMVFDWVAATGLLAMGWVALVLVAIVRSPGTTSRRESVLSDWAPALKAIAGAGLLVVLLVLVRVQTLEMVVLGLDVSIVRIVGWVSFLAIAMLVGWLWCRTERGFKIGLCAAALVLVLHAQLEMSIDQAESAPWLLCLLGVAAPVAARRSRIGGATGMVAVAICLLLGGAMLFVVRGPVVAQEFALSTRGTIGNKDSVWESGLVGLSGRLNAAQALMVAAQPRQDERLSLAAANHLLTGIAMATVARYPVSESQLEEARTFLVDSLRTLHDQTGSTASGRLLIEVLTATDDEANFAEAIGVARQVASADPAGLWSQRLLADLLFEHGDPNEAAEVYQRVLLIHEASVIDPLRQLSEADERRIRARLERP